MTTIRQIIVDAYRESGTIQIGTTPTGAQLDEGLRKLRTLLKSMYGNEIGEPFIDITYGRPATSNSYAEDYDFETEIDSIFVPSNARLNVYLDAAKTVYLNPMPNDGERFSVIDVAGNFATYNFTVNGNGRNIEGAATTVLSTDGDTKSWMYRADLGEWVLIETVSENDQSPFPEEFDDLLSIRLAMRLFPRYLQSVAPETMDEYRRLLKIFKARYKQTRLVDSEEALLRTNSNRRYYYSNNFRPETLFNVGRLK